jgi:magnesium-transporting ATPase (P-type)
MKGALRTIAVLAGLDEAATANLERQAGAAARSGARVLAVARADEDGPLRLAGLALLRDAPRPDSRKLIEELRAHGVRVKMLTGDALPVAEEIARDLGVGHVLRASELREATKAGDARATELVERSDGFAERGNNALQALFSLSFSPAPPRSRATRGVRCA